MDTVLTEVIVAGQLRVVVEVVVDDLALVVELGRTDDEEVAQAFQSALLSAAALVAATTKAAEAVVNFMI